MNTAALALAVGSLIIMVGIFYKRRHLGLAAVIFLLPFERLGSYALASNGAHTIRLVQIAAAALIASVALRQLSRGRLWRPKLPLPLWLFLASTFISAAAINHPRVWQNYLWVLFVAALFGLVAKLAQANDLRLPSRALILSAALVSVYGLFQFAGDSLGWPSNITGLRPGYSSAILGYPRIHSVAIEPLNFANYLLIPLFTMLAFWIVQGGRLRTAGYLAFAVICLAFALTTSRGAFIALVPGALVLVLTLRKRLRPPKWSVVIGVILAIGLTAFALMAFASARSRGDALAGPRLFARMISTKFTDNASFQERAAANTQVKEVFMARPWFGYGLGKAGADGASSPKRAAYDKLNPMNSGWELLAEAGLVGTFCFLWFLLSVWRQGARVVATASHPRQIALAAGLTAATIAIAIQALSFSAFYISYIWVALGLIYGLGSRKQPTKL